MDNSWHRYYDYQLGRFTQVDPLWQKYPSMSPYVYAANNPLRFVDPDGRKTWPAQSIKIRASATNPHVGYYGFSRTYPSGKPKMHRGVDISGNKGDNIFSYDDGVVKVAGDFGGKYGKGVIIVHPDGSESHYYHLSDVDWNLKPGDNVKEGQNIGGMGETGNAKGEGDQVHFGVKVNSEFVDPGSQFGLWDRFVNWFRGTPIPETNIENVDDR